MTTAITIQELILFLLGIGGIILIIFLIMAVKSLIDSLKSASKILKDFETISSIAAQRASDIDGIIDDVTASVGNVTKNLKGKSGITQVISAVVSLMTTLKGFSSKKKKESSDTDKK